MKRSGARVWRKNINRLSQFKRFNILNAISELRFFVFLVFRFVSQSCLWVVTRVFSVKSNCFILFSIFHSLSLSLIFSLWWLGFEWFIWDISRAAGVGACEDVGIFIYLFTVHVSEMQFLCMRALVRPHKTHCATGWFSCLSTCSRWMLGCVYDKWLLHARVRAHTHNSKLNILWCESRASTKWWIYLNFSRNRMQRDSWFGKWINGSVCPVLCVTRLHLRASCYSTLYLDSVLWHDFSHHKRNKQRTEDLTGRILTLGAHAAHIGYYHG